MKYSTEIVIQRSVSDVIALFDNPDNLHLWMEGLQKFEPLSGTPGQPGAQSKLTFKMGQREMTMIETIEVRQLPEEFSGVYEVNGIWNRVVNRFREIDSTSTLYISEHEFRFKGVMRVMAFLMPGMFKKQSLKHLQAFKRFAESQAAV